VGTTAIIGHGKTVEGRGWGPMINAQACVVRMWDCQWQTEVDYGSRYDYGLIEVHKGVMDKFWAHNARQPAIGWIASTMDKVPIPLPSPV